MCAVQLNIVNIPICLYIFLVEFHVKYSPIKLILNIISLSSLFLQKMTFHDHFLLYIKCIIRVYHRFLALFPEPETIAGLELDRTNISLVRKPMIPKTLGFFSIVSNVEAEMSANIQRPLFYCTLLKVSYPA